ncbi:hypothetical protein EC988_001973, partial [Linderina pennispora]
MVATAVRCHDIAVLALRIFARHFTIICCRLGRRHRAFIRLVVAGKQPLHILELQPFGLRHHQEHKRKADQQNARIQPECARGSDMQSHGQVCDRDNEIAHPVGGGGESAGLATDALCENLRLHQPGYIAQANCIQCHVENQRCQRQPRPGPIPGGLGLAVAREIRKRPI